jgi:XRE family transcriptional regulator, aerobic/anaerobic benzoate catabolism transcriptional regulator
LAKVTRQKTHESETQDLAGTAYLTRLGDRVRELRSRRGMTRRILARDSGVSERYLAQLEAGKGNISVLLLRQLARALDMPIEALSLDGPEPSADLQHLIAFLSRLSPAEIPKAHALLVEKFGSSSRSERNTRIALIGLRGAGKSTLGSLLAGKLGFPFVELDKEIEQAANAPLSAIFDLYGQPGFRRLERHCLDRIVRTNPRVVIATGGGIVSEPSTFEHLILTCRTIWLRASPAEHMRRVVAQGDMRPMADNRQSMSDLRRILKTREALYGKADMVIDTSGKTADQSLEELQVALMGNQGG